MQIKITSYLWISKIWMGSPYHSCYRIKSLLNYSCIFLLCFGTNHRSHREAFWILMHTFDDLKSSERIMPNYAWMCDDGFHVQLDFDSANVGHIDALHFQMSSNRLYPFRILGIWSSSMYMFCPPTHQKNFIVFFSPFVQLFVFIPKRNKKTNLFGKLLENRRANSLTIFG